MTSQPGAVLLGAFLSLYLCLPAQLSAQDLFVNAYGGTGNEWAYSIQQTTDGGYVLSGPSSSFGAGGYDFWIAKLDASGSIVWQKTYGGTSDDMPNSMQQTTDGGYVLAGRTQSFGAGNFDVWVLKLDGSGNRVWQRSFGGTGLDAAYSIQQTLDGSNYYVSAWMVNGTNGYDFLLIKLDSSGNSVWQRTYGGKWDDYPYASCLTTDGGVVMAGATTLSSGATTDDWVVKVNSSGNVVWQKAFGGTQNDAVQSISTTADGGFILAGRTESFGAGNMDLWILKLDASGNTVWQETYGGSGIDWGFAAQQTPDGGYLAAGRTDSFSAGSGDAWILKLDASGNSEWQKRYGGTGMDYAYAVSLAADGSLLVGGVTASLGAGNYDAMFLKLEASCLLGGSCPYFSMTAVSPATAPPTVTTTSRNAATPSTTSLTTVPLWSNPAGARTVGCSYPLLPSSITVLVSKTGDDPILSWQTPSCAVQAYEIYRGTLPFTSYNHQSVECNGSGLGYTDYSSGENQYYLVVPRNSYLEGSYGIAFDGSFFYERPPGSSACKPQCLFHCP